MEFTDQDYETLVEQYETMMAAKDDIESGMKAIRELLLEKMKNDNLQGTIVDEFALSVVKQTRYNSVPLEYAKQVSAVKQSVDTSKLRKLHQAGVNVPNVKEYEYVLIKRMEQDNE